jgi:hypothetical protein
MAPKKKGPSLRTQQQRKLQMQKIAKGGPQLSGTKGMTAKAPAASKAAPSKPIGTGKGGISKPSGSSMKADAKSWQRLNQTASAKSAKAAEPRPRTPAPGTGNVEKQAIDRGRAALEAQRRAIREAKQAKGNYGKLAGTAAKMAGNATKALLGSKLGNGSVHVMVAKEALTARNTADGTLKGKPTGNPQGPAVPKRLTQGGLDKGSFDSAFKASRSAGKKTFTWRGKKYNTKLKGE